MPRISESSQERSLKAVTYLLQHNQRATVQCDGNSVQRALCGLGEKYNVFGLRFSENGGNTCPTYFTSSHGKKMEKQFKNYKAL